MKRNEDLPDNFQWHVIYTLPRMEKKLEGYLHKYGFEALAPKVTVKRKWKDRWKMIDKPIFNSYIFVRMDYWKQKKKVIVLPGVHHFVFYKGAPATVGEEDIEMMNIFVENFSEKMEVKKIETLKPGNHVVVQHGPFAGKTAEILRTGKGLNHVVVRFPMIGQALRVEISTEDLGLEEAPFKTA